MLAKRAGLLQGLSPRVRGNRIAVSKDSIRLRSIPACAGEPIAKLMDAHLNAVYPRVCGGTVVKRGPGTLRRGLSPRVRGNHR